MKSKSSRKIFCGCPPDWTVDWRGEPSIKFYSKKNRYDGSWITSLYLSQLPRGNLVLNTCTHGGSKWKALPFSKFKMVDFLSERNGLDPHATFRSAFPRLYINSFSQASIKETHCQTHWTESWHSAHICPKSISLTTHGSIPLCFPRDNCHVRRDLQRSMFWS